MTQEDKDLLLKDLGERLPYGVKVYVNQDELQKSDNYWKNWNFNEEPQEIDMVSIYGVTFECMDIDDGIIGFEYIKPYLFPLSSMNEEQREEFICTFDYSCVYDIDNERIPTIKTFDWCNKNHFDYRGLIPMGLAIDATNLNVY